MNTKAPSIGPKVGIVPLGCPKALVDSERIHVPASRHAQFAKGGMKMGKLLITLTIATALFAAPGHAQRFSFVALGDTAYQLPRDRPRYERLIDVINAARPAFAVHVGDFKGYTSCSDDAYRDYVALFRRHQHALILTPGDNDWTDCSAESAGSFDPLERLGALRRIFYSAPRSLGQRPISLTQQSELPENARWTHARVVFATLHVIGPHNNLVSTDVRLATESVQRTQADQTWLRAAFAEAKSRRAPALVLAFQVDPWLASAPVYEDGPLDWIRSIIRAEAADYSGQVLIVHGDSHRLTIDQPFRRIDIERGTSTGMNITRLQVPGWPDHRAVLVDVHTDRPNMFAFAPILAADEALGARP